MTKNEARAIGQTASDAAANGVIWLGTTPGAAVVVSAALALAAAGARHRGSTSRSSPRACGRGVTAPSRDDRRTTQREHERFVANFYA